MLALALLLAAQEPPEDVRALLRSTCLDCHDGEKPDGGLNLAKTGFDLADRGVFERWVLVHDRVRAGEMPPRDHDELTAGRIAAFAAALAAPLEKADRARVAASGRSKVRRLNRFEYEATLRDVLHAPWLRVAEMLPEDGTAHLFNKLGERLDVSHVQVSRFLAAAERAVRASIHAAAFPSESKRYYAREDPQMIRYMRYRQGNNDPTRTTIPLLGTTAQIDVLRDQAPLSVGAADPETREREAFGVVSGTYAATLKYDFTQAHVPAPGRYKVRLRSWTFTAGPNGRQGGNDQGLTGGNAAWWRPSRGEAFPGKRSEPVTLYALARAGDSRWLGTFDARPDPSVGELEVVLDADETIRPDASRLVRTRPGWAGNPNATREGVPGLALSWLEIEGPLNEEWPPASYRALFDDLPFRPAGPGAVEVVSRNPEADARRLLARLLKRAYRRPAAAEEVEPFVAIWRRAVELGESFTDAMASAFAALLCSPDVLYLESRPGTLADHALAARLSYYLWNAPPDAGLRALADAGRLKEAGALEAQAERLLSDARSRRFVEAFLDYWLSLRDLNANAPDASLYPDYYLDDLLTESSLLETRSFFQELVEKNLPARNLVHSSFAFVNERLAEHYGLPSFEGVAPRRVDLPPGSPRGGLLGQASVLRVTANGTTSSPVLRGVWIVERILGVHVPPPPSGVPAVEPDIRGAVTIREQLDKHRSLKSCAGCHVKFDPLGFALESFDVAGGWRERYRAMGEVGERVTGVGKNGHLFTFRRAQPVETSGTLADGRAFADIHELKRLLLADERKIARNLLERLLVYATGGAVGFSDRAEVERLLDETSASGYGVRDLILAAARSRLFRLQ